MLISRRHKLLLISLTCKLACCFALMANQHFAPSKNIFRCKFYGSNVECKIRAAPFLSLSFLPRDCFSVRVSSTISQFSPLTFVPFHRQKASFSIRNRFKQQQLTIKRVPNEMAWEEVEEWVETIYKVWSGGRKGKTRFYELESLNFTAQFLLDNFNCLWNSESFSSWRNWKWQ